MSAPNDPYQKLRQRMIRDQLEARGVRDERVLRALGTVPREAFVPAFVQKSAYVDRPLHIGYGQTISQPFMVALMTEALDLKGHERLLEVGTGSGYQTAVFAELSAEVYSMERIQRLSMRAEKVLSRLGYRNVNLRVGDGSLGWPEEGPFDAILVAAAATSLPITYRQQLCEGGKLIIPVGHYAEQTLKRCTRRGDQYEVEDLGRVSFVPLVVSK